VAGTGPFQGTDPDAINNGGVIAGTYVDSNLVSHGFVLIDGQYTTVDDPLAAPVPHTGTEVAAIDVHGDIMGTYFDANGVGHGFVATPASSHSDIADGAQGIVPSFAAASPNARIVAVWSAVTPEKTDQSSAPLQPVSPQAPEGATKVGSAQSSRGQEQFSPSLLRGEPHLSGTAHPSAIASTDLLDQLFAVLE
jgi:hypothetical protein